MCQGHLIPEDLLYEIKDIKKFQYKKNVSEHRNSLRLLKSSLSKCNDDDKRDRLIQQIENKKQRINTLTQYTEKARIPIKEYNTVKQIKGNKLSLTYDNNNADKKYFGSNIKTSVFMGYSL